MKPNSVGVDYWREYFRPSNRSIFDIIDGAIMVAASDCPQEFKLRRDRIAERLFSCRLARCSGCDRVELAVPSGGEDVDRDDEDGLMKSGIAGDGDARGGSKVNSTGRDDRRDTALNREANYSHGGAEALTDDIGEESRILEEVSRIKGILMNYEEESESVLFESLRRLQSMELTVAMLKGTGIGITVNLMRKHGSKQISRLALALISLWKSMVDEWMQTTQDIPGGTPDSVNPSTVVDEEEEDEEGLPSPPLDEGAFLTTEPTPVELSRFFDGMDDDGNPHNTRELPSKCGNGRKSSLQKPNSNGIDQQIQKRPNGTRNPARNEKPEPLRNGSLAVKPNRFANGNSERERHADPIAERKIDMKLQPGRLEKPAITMRGQCPVNQQDDSKCTDEEAAAQMRLEAAKRKLQERYQEVQNAKKQRTIQVMDLPHQPKRAAGINGRNPPARPLNHKKQWANGRR
ncbi:hypothetical protein MLD38_004503 [Melastoma candidum]|uniref:Uncharacterized protein n=1 Tax=Melastoma candidum TaxID=119954 RepID=A0ACB9S782_9MYRT|nr:hypothetical protein MLD38_004503 [Melastoma candidum]